MFLKFDKNTGFLDIGKMPAIKRGTVYEPTDMYRSYKKYLDYGVKQDIKELFIPELNKILSDLAEQATLSDVEVIFDRTDEFIGHDKYNAYVTLDLARLNGDTDKFRLLSLPFMDEYSFMKKDGKEYALIGELVQDDDITYNQGELKLITAGGCYVNLKESKVKPRMKFGDKKFHAHTVLCALASVEGIDADKLLSKLISRNFARTFNSEFDRLRAVEYCMTPDMKIFLEALKSEAYSLKKVRDKLNKTLSIDRAIGHKLADDVVLNDGTTIQSETIITSNIIKKLKLSRCNEVLVLDVPRLDGNYLANDVRLSMLRKGTPLIPEIKCQLEDVKGNYLNHTIKSPDVSKYIVVIPRGTLINGEMLEALVYNGLNEITVKPGPTSQTIITYPLVRTIVGNRCFTEAELGLSNNDKKYVYVNEDGSITEPSSSLTAYDLAAMLSLYDRLCSNEDHFVIAHRDLGLRKRVNMANESFHKAFERAIKVFFKKYKRKIRTVYDTSPEVFLSADKVEPLFYGFTIEWWKQLREMKVVQRVDKSNPTAFYSSFAKINSIVADKNAITSSQRSLSMGHYGRICPYETPSGKSLGVVGNRAIGLKVDDGIMKTPYYRVKHVGGTSYIDLKEKVYLTVEEEEKFRIADITSLDFDFETGHIRTVDKVLARVPSASNLEKMNVQHIDVAKVDLVNVDPSQTDGLVATTIPFQGADDSTRVIFGLSMAKQAKPLPNPEVPIVCTSGFYNIPRMSPYFMIQAEYDGEIVEAYPGMIAVFYYELNDVKVYKFEANEFSKESVIIRKLEVKEGDIVKAGDILVSSNFVKDGMMATGINALVAYIPEGYNYEDGVFGSQRLSRKLTSYGSSVEDRFLSKNYKSYIVERVNNFAYKNKESSIYAMTRYVGETPDRVTVYSKHLKGFLVDVSKVYDPDTKKEKCFRAKAVSFDPLNKGDKIANRHGNKGVTPIIQDNNSMPCFSNGEFVDLCYNPAGVSSRMNLGQILECNLGLAAYILGIKILSDSFNGADEYEIQLLLQYAWDLANIKDADSVFTNPKYSCLPKELHEWCQKRLSEIRFWKGAFNPDGTAWLFNPRTGKLFANPVLVGINYIYKLIHVADKKLHGRAGFCTEPYVEKLEAPPKGASKDGGQRQGYMELDAYAGYGASALMHEMLNERSDNYIARNDLTVDYLHTGSSSYKLGKGKSIRRSTEFFVSLMRALGVVIDFEGVLPNNTKAEMEDREMWKAETLIKATQIKPRENIKSLSDTKKALAQIE